MRLLDYLLSDFKWYRKRIGGNWYYVSDPSLSGFSSDIIGWVRESKGMRVEKEEHYVQVNTKKSKIISNVKMIAAAISILLFLME